MRKKLGLDVDRLSVESFATTPEGEAPRGTVRANVIQPTPPEYEPPPCTCDRTCLCKTAYFHCGTGYHTLFSCEYTGNASCLV
jgi:hypothetical protein